MAQDAVMEQIQAAIARLQGGDREGARRDFESIWGDLSPERQPLHACVLAHFMADAQDRIEDELDWDLRAYEAATHTDDAQTRTIDPGLEIRHFMPSLHLNLANDYHRLGRPQEARRHLERATACLETAPATPYMDTIRGGVARLEQRLAGSAA